MAFDEKGIVILDDRRTSNGIPYEFDVRPKLLASGQSVLYSVSDLTGTQMVREYPDGSRFVVDRIDGEMVEIAPYEGIEESIKNRYQ